MLLPHLNVPSRAAVMWDPVCPRHQPGPFRLPHRVLGKSCSELQSPVVGKPGLLLIFPLQNCIEIYLVCRLRAGRAETPLKVQYTDTSQHLVQRILQSTREGLGSQ